MNPTQIIITLADGRQILVDQWPSGIVEVSERPVEGEPWTPVGEGNFGGHVRVVPAA